MSASRIDWAVLILEKEKEEEKLNSFKREFWRAKREREEWVSERRLEDEEGVTPVTTVSF
jgi:hypothetical protein